jgi:hypothetical protein
MEPKDLVKPRRRNRKRGSECGIVRASLLAVVVLLLGLLVPTESQAQATCAKHYVAGGDDIPAGNTVSSSQTYPSHLVNDHMAKYGYCVYNTAQNGTTSSTYISGGQLGTARNRAPDFITLSVGEQDTPINNEIGSCFNSVKSHDFAGALTCAAGIQANSTAFTNLNNDLITTMQGYKMIMSGRPNLVVAIVGYPDPFPQSSDVITPIAQLCEGTTDTIVSCTTRWTQMPPALTALDSVVQKLNTTIANAVQPFNTGYQGHFIFVNPYQKFLSHEMKMDVTLKLDQVCHFCCIPDSCYMDNHKSEQNIGSGSPWFQAGSDGSDTPFYLQPADQIIDPPVVLELESQTTSGMGVYPNDTGNKCISDLVWEAVKVKLGIPEPPNSNICQ